MLIIGIAGGTGSGKTTVVKRIMEKLDKDEVVRNDSRSILTILTLSTGICCARI